MKKILLLFLFILLYSCGAGQDVKISETGDIEQRPDGLKGSLRESVNSSQSNSNSAVAPFVEFTDSLQVKEILSFLASDELEGRDSGSEGIEKAARFIESYFQENGIEKYYSSYRDTITNYQPASYNIIGLVRGTDPLLAKEYIVIGAHYDHVGIIGSGISDKIANGANDNASGTTAVLEIARYFAENRTNGRSLLFVLFSAEEKGLLGSNHLAKKLREEDLDLYAMLNFEMIGVPMKNKDYLLYLTGFNRSNLAELCNKYAGENLVGFLPEAKQYQLFQRSDNYPFHQAFGVPSQTYCTFDFTNYDHYHKVGDEAELMDYGHMAEVVNKMIPVMEGLSNGKDKELKYN